MTFSKILVVGLVALFALSQLIYAASPSLRLQGQTGDDCNYKMLNMSCDDHCNVSKWHTIECKQGPATPPQWFTCTCRDPTRQAIGQSDLDVDDDKLLLIPIEAFNEDSLEGGDLRKKCTGEEDSKCQNLCTKNGFSVHTCVKQTHYFTYCLCRGT